MLSEEWLSCVRRGQSRDYEMMINKIRKGGSIIELFEKNNLPQKIERGRFASRKPIDNIYHKVLYPYDKKPRQDGFFTYKWLCQCNCGQYFGVWQVKEKMTCSRCNSKIIGKKYNLLTVLRRVEKDETMTRQGEYYLCQCDCGNQKITHYKNIVSGDVKSCGCLQRKTPLYDKVNTVIEHKAGIYMFQNIFNGHCYVGKTKDLQNRYWQHKHCRDGKNHQKQLYQAFDKYGFDNYNFIILEKYDTKPSEAFLSEREEYYIEKYNCYKQGYNASDCSSGGFYSEEHKQKCCLVLDELNERQKGLNHPRSKLSEQELQEIYSYAMRGAPSTAVWELMKEKLKGKLTKNSFTQLYHGAHYDELKPEGWESRPKVFSNSVFWGEDIIDMRKRYAAGEPLDSIYKDYQDKCPEKPTFLHAIKGKTYKNIIIS